MTLIFESLGQDSFHQSFHFVFCIRWLIVQKMIPYLKLNDQKYTPQHSNINYVLTLCRISFQPKHKDNPKIISDFYFNCIENGNLNYAWTLKCSFLASRQDKILFINYEFSNVILYQAMILIMLHFIFPYIYQHWNVLI